MNIIGIIGEYNPLHRGHTYQLQEAKNFFPNSCIILITNSTFTQRGDVSIINKWNKTRASLENGIDLVIELPFVYATQSADIFAKGAMEILNYIGIDTLIFGSETNDIEKLIKIAQTQLNNSKYQELVKEYLKTGINYPTATSKALIDVLGYTIKEANDLLGLAYVKEIIKNNYKIKPFSIKRTNNYHDRQVYSNIVNASLIRKLYLENEDISSYVPLNVDKYLYKNLSLESYFPYLKYKILSSDNLNIYQTVEEGIEGRIKKAIKYSNNWEELVFNIKTKRYTYNKINRMLVHILTSFTKTEANSINVDYVRVLGFNSKGRWYLNKIKRDIKIPIIMKYKKDFSHVLDIELRATCIYSLPLDNSLINKEYYLNPVIVNSEKDDIF